MTRRRIHKISEAVRQVVSTAILTDLWDPRVKNITVTKVGISGDMRRATIHISVMGSDKEQELSLRGLRHSKGFLQSKIAEKLSLRYTPVLSFELDQGIKRSFEMSQLLDQVDAERRGDQRSLDPPPSAASPPEDSTHV